MQPTRKGDPTRDEVLAWLAETGAGPIAAVRHFWDPHARKRTHKRQYDLVYSWQSTERKRKKPRKPAKGTAAPKVLPPAPEPLADATPIEKLRAEIAHTREMRAAMAADHSWSAWAMVSRYLRQLEEARRRSRSSRAPTSTRTTTRPSSRPCCLAAAHPARSPYP